MHSFGCCGVAWSMQALRLQEGTTKVRFFTSRFDSASSLHRVQASAPERGALRATEQSEDSARASGAREILETVLHLLYASSCSQTGQLNTKHAGNMSLQAEQKKRERFLPPKPTKKRARSAARPHLHMPTCEVEP